ncbi:MAG TPA: hypothetical protein VHG08_14835 [Longimicrobium sp.]|nr:hypothetical protein [Longimicrobium sp.]
MAHVTLDEARAAKPVVLQWFSRLGEVVGVGITRVRDDYAVKVNLREPVGPGIDVPSRIEGVPVRVEVTGTVRAQ